MVAELTLTLDQIYTIFHDLIVDMLAFEPKKVRKAYQQDGQPNINVDSDIIYLFVNEIDQSYNKIRDYSYNQYNDDNSQQVVVYTRIIDVLVSTFGPNSYDNGRQIRSKVLNGTSIDALRQHQIFPLPNIASPIALPYDFNGQWWNRYDVHIQCNVGTVETAVVPYFTEANIDVVTNNISESINI